VTTINSSCAQLTFRTNQFNFTTVRRSENEIRDYVKRDHADRSGRSAWLTDFGDYGLFGVALYETEATGTGWTPCC